MNWLLIAVLLILAGMTIWGYVKGFLKLLISATSFIIAIALVYILTPHVSSFLKYATPLQSVINDNIDLRFGVEELDTEMPSEVQVQIIDGLNLPNPIKSMLTENNNSEIHEILGVNSFKEYVSKYLTNIIINMVGFLITFIIIFAMLKITVHLLDLVEKVPVIKGINKFAGAVLGLAEGGLIVCFIFLLIAIFSTTEIGVLLLTQINSNRFLLFLYKENKLVELISELISTMF